MRAKERERSVGVGDTRDRQAGSWKDQELGRRKGKGVFAVIRSNANVPGTELR